MKGNNLPSRERVPSGKVETLTPEAKTLLAACTLSLAESTTFLIARSGRSASDPQIHAAAELLATELGCLPLALEQAGMRDALEKAPYHLSAGEKRRVALAGVLAMDPEILVLDEPTTFLDPPAQRNLLNLLRSLPQAKLIVTHNTRFASALASRAVFFEKGKLVAEGTVEEIVQRYDWTYSALPEAVDLRYSAQRRF